MSEGRVPLINLRMTQGRFSSRSRANIWMSNRQHFETALPSTPFCQKPRRRLVVAGVWHRVWVDGTLRPLTVSQGTLGGFHRRPGGSHRLLRGSLGGSPRSRHAWKIYAITVRACARDVRTVHGSKLV